MSQPKIAAPIAPEKFRKLSLRELHVLFDAAQAARDAWNGISNTPRARDLLMDGDGVVNDERERCNLIIDVVYREARRRRPTEAQEIRARGEIIIGLASELGIWGEVIEAATAMMAADAKETARIRAKAA
jgi:hypothetical protein